MSGDQATAERCCPLCNGRDLVPFRFGLLRCGGCGLVVDRQIFAPQLDRQLNQEAFGEQYEPQQSLWVRGFEARKNRRYLANLRRAGVRGGRLLEVGVGSGSFLAAARAARFEPVGCELSRSLAERVERRTGVPVHCGDLASLPAGAFDVVCMHHVLEHVSDPVGLLQAARDRLAPGGVLHLAVPNIACWEARLSGWNSYEYYHMTYFDRETLRHALTIAGFTVQSVHSHESFSAWFLAVARTIGGVRSIEPSPPETLTDAQVKSQWRAIVEHPYRLAMFAAGVLTWPLRLVQGRLGHGDELIAIVRREG